MATTPYLLLVHPSVPANNLKELVALSKRYGDTLAVDGISLTVAGVTRTGFRLWIIPHTFAVTNLRARSGGDVVNLEADLLGKYVGQMLDARRARK